ncbi:MAG: ubiquinol-cytochrome c reductase iron-sulfur subunit [Actinomycetota bacterium]
MTTLAKVSPALWAGIGFAVLIALGGYGLIAKNMRGIMQIRKERSTHAPLLGRPPQVTRRTFFRKMMLIGFGAAMLDFAAASLAFLWPVLKGGFGSKVTLGPSADEIKAQITATKKPFYFAPGRFYLVAYDTSDGSNLYVKSGVAAGGLMALYQRCVHLGCRVPFCESSQWFECPCHGSKYNRAGEYRLGPAPHGMDRMVMTVDSGKVTVDTGDIILGPPRGTNTTGQNAEGPFCLAPVKQHK